MFSYKKKKPLLLLISVLVEIEVNNKTFILFEFYSCYYRVSFFVFVILNDPPSIDQKKRLREII